MTQNVTDRVTELTLFKGVQDWRLPIMVLDRQYRFVFANAAYLKATHKELPDLLGRHVFDAFPDEAERVETVFEHFERCFSGEFTQLNAQPFTIENVKGEEELRYWQSNQEPIRGACGSVTHLLQYTEDVTLRVEAEKERNIVAQELNHRVKNVLNVIQSIARLSSRGQTSVAEFTEEFILRVNAMSRVHSRLYQNDYEGTSLRELLQDELGAMFVDSICGFALDGDDVWLTAKLSKDLSMVIHELATNAAKYGCFSKEAGQLDVRWIVKDDCVELLWRETGVGPVGELSGTGFGSKLIRIVKDIECHRSGTDDGLEIKLIINHTV